MFGDNDDLGRSYKTDEIFEKFYGVRVFCVCMSYSTSFAILLISLQIASRSKKKLTKVLGKRKQAGILYSFSLVWLIDIAWVMYLDYKVLMDYSGSHISEDVYSERFIYFIVIADFILISFVLITTPFLCKETFFQRCCKLGDSYVTASKEYLVISTFMIFTVIHANHLIFILFGYLVEPIHAIAKFIEFITVVAYFITVFNIIFRKYKDNKQNRFLHYSKLVMHFCLYFLIIFFMFSYLLYHDLIVTENQSLIKSISISTLVWLVILLIYFSYRWSRTVNFATITVNSANNNKNIVQVNQSQEMEQARDSPGCNKSPRKSSLVVDFTHHRIDQIPLIDSNT